MKYALALALFALTLLPARADGPPDYYEMRHSARYQTISTSTYERRLRREYAAFKAERARAARAARLRRLEALERAEARRNRTARARAEERRLRRLEAALVREEARERRAAKRRRARDRRYEERDYREKRLMQEERLLREENRRYAAQRAAANIRYDDDGEYAERRGATAMCRPAVTAYGFPKLGRGPAEAVARRAWISQVELNYSKAYSNPNRARNKRYVCDEDRSRRMRYVFTCRFRAAPCRAEF